MTTLHNLLYIFFDTVAVLVYPDDTQVSECLVLDYIGKLMRLTGVKIELSVQVMATDDYGKCSVLW